MASGTDRARAARRALGTRPATGRRWWGRADRAGRVARVGRTPRDGGRPRLRATTARRARSRRREQSRTAPDTTRHRPARHRASALRRPDVAKTDACVCATPLDSPAVPGVERMKARSRDDVLCVFDSSGASDVRRAGSVVEVVDVGREGHLLDRRLHRAFGDQECGLGGGDPNLERCRLQRGRARDRDGADLDDAEDDLEPIEAALGENHHPVLGSNAMLAEDRGPMSGPLGDLHERPRLDDAVLAQAGQGASLRIAGERVDHVTREVEVVRDVPALVLERWSERKLDWRARRRVRSPAATADAETFHGTSIIDPIGVEAESEYITLHRVCRNRLQEAQFGGKGLAGRKALRKPESSRLLERGDPRRAAEGAC